MIVSMVDAEADSFLIVAEGKQETGGGAAKGASFNWRRIYPAREKSPSALFWSLFHHNKPEHTYRLVKAYIMNYTVTSAKDFLLG